MYRYILFAGFLAVACAAPTAVSTPDSESKSPPVQNPPVTSTLPPAPVPSPKALSLISEIKTPASTAKLTHLVTPLVAPISRIAYASPLYPQLSPLAYTYPALAPVEIAAAPSTYSIEQHGYHITY